MGIYRKQGKGKVTYQWKIQHKGITHTGTFDTDSQRMAEQEYALKLAEIRRGINPKQKIDNVLFDDFFPACTKQYKFLTPIHAQLMKAFSGKTIVSISSTQCEDFRNSLVGTSARNSQKVAMQKPLSNNSINRYFAELSGVFREAKRRKIISVNPCHGVEALPVATKERQVWTPEEARRALSYCVGERSHLYPLLAVALQTALSRKDLFQLKVSEIHFTENGGSIHKLRAKTGNKIDIPLSAEAIKILKPLCEGKGPDELVFISKKTGLAYTSNEFAFRTLCRLAKVPHFRWHDARRYVGTRLAEAGADISVISRYLAHKTYDQARVYVNIATNAIQPHANILADGLKEPERQKNVENVLTLRKVKR